MRFTYHPETTYAELTMAAPEGNQFWKLRSKHGRDKLFETPELLWEACCEYFEWCEANPLIEIDFRGKDASEVELPKMRPFTLQGLCLYLGCNTGYFRDFRAIVNAPDRSGDIDLAEGFSSVITRIEEIIYNQKFTGAATGFFNANIIARDLGLADKQDHKHEIPNAEISIEIVRVANNES